MSAKPIQISIDTDLLHYMDRDPEAQERGRSAFIRTAAEHYLSTKRRRSVDERIARAYEGQADAMLEEIVDLLGDQARPKQ
jgi:metal-responsive CopG/Arc/MetJ family transcriptional regulator